MLAQGKDAEKKTHDHLGFGHKKSHFVDESTPKIAQQNHEMMLWMESVDCSCS